MEFNLVKETQHNNQAKILITGTSHRLTENQTHGILITENKGFGHYNGTYDNSNIITLNK